MNISIILSLAASRWAERECVVEITPEKNMRRALSYKAFNERVNRFSNALLDMGIKQGDIVMTFMRNCVEWMETYFGIIRIGAIVAPLNFRFTGEDIKHSVGLTGARLIVFHEDLSDVLNKIRPDLRSIDYYVSIGKNVDEVSINYEEIMSGSPSSEPGIDISDDDLLGVYFTSGTTGVPKAVSLTHKNFFMVAVQNFITFPPGPESNYIAILPLYHMASFFQWLPYMFKGAKCTLLQEFQPHTFLDTMGREKGTEVFLVMPMLIDILEAERQGRIRVADYDLHAWEHLNTGSQAYPRDLLLGAKRMFPEVKINHGYGLSEGGGAASLVLEPQDIIRKCGSIGKPVAAMVDAKIVNDEGKEVPSGETGELIIKSERVMRGYYKNPEETSKILKDGWLYTGDIARMDEEGYFYIVDRKKDIIISGGENVFPTEVEEDILKHPKILDAAVIGVADDRFGEKVMAVVKLKEGEEMTKEEFLDWCRDRFPGYRRPRRVEFGEIPRGATRKTLKPLLRKLYGGGNEAR